MQQPFLANALPPTRFYSLMHQCLMRAYPAIRKEMYDSGCDVRPLYHSFIDACGVVNIISSPCHDLVKGSNSMKEVPSGNLSIIEVVDSVLSMTEIMSKPYRLLIPIAQTNGARKHWTLLYLTQKFAYHYDSTGPRSLPYNLDNVAEAAKRITASELKCFYLGHQGAINNRDCGLFVMSYTLLLLQNKQLSGLSTDSVVTMFLSVAQKAEANDAASAVPEEESANCDWE